MYKYELRIHSPSGSARSSLIMAHRRNVPTTSNREQGLPPTRRSTHPHIQAAGEYIDIDNVSGSESEDHSRPTQQSGQGEAPTAQDTIHVNNPEITASKSTSAADVHHFFEKTKDKWVCRECK
jgi:hypothetical protein